MTNEDTILTELKAIRSILEARMEQVPRRRMMKVPEVAEATGLPAPFLRQLIKDGTIPARCINPDAKSKHYILDLNDVIAALKSDN